MSVKANLKLIFEEVGDVGADVEGVSNPLPLVLGGVDAEEGLVDFRPLLLVLEVADDEAHEVGHHRHRLFKLENEKLCSFKSIVITRASLNCITLSPV